MLVPDENKQLTQKEKEQLKQEVIKMLKTCYDPEIPVDIYELGMIYEIEIYDDANVYIKMTLTTPMCPVADTLPAEVRYKVKSVEGVKDCYVDLVWEPAWDKSMMSETAKMQLSWLF
ncbi:MAG TPA: iron-sulfur cluster assembly protein [Ignavibacteriales bacterium]|nr:iron-sulfur cluster assembly protein [Ignavibacteriales bacterium]HOL80586.1 iron-sulfur cluster assembly protein [Ignavibacteriales bacterium]HOM64276.1 iron-sulfur cluster assembly protein [Ignavibacteriales bacterium]HPD68445.1 iron-sulfur cluster assembly protein [Ignavibacteriales bacterium]HPP33078.1 iron-sulfur cluster assembly protein [Ignavibacteriales bacterium]